MGQRLSKNTRQELLSASRAEYQSATHYQRKKLLSAFAETTGLSRKYANRLLKGTTARSYRKRGRRSDYDAAVVKALEEVWAVAGFICGKRLIAFLPDLVPKLEALGYLTFDTAVREKLLRVSAATADRLLVSARQKISEPKRPKPPPNMLRKRIPVHTRWSDVSPGFLEIDLVLHGGGDSAGQFVHTLTATDIHSGWTELIALPSKKESEVASALPGLEASLPFALLGLDSDNGYEFLNVTMERYCEVRQVSLTRGREYECNDQAHVEQKNREIVRKYAGYGRLQGRDQCRLLNNLYRYLRLYVNFFQPSMKLASRRRTGSHVHKTYHPAQTPCQRLLSADIPEEQKERLRRTFAKLDPIKLRELIKESQQALASLDPTVEPHCRTPLGCSPKQPKPRKPRKPRKLQKSSFEKLMPIIHELLVEDPFLSAARLMRKVNERYPGSVQPMHHQSFQRILRQWHAAYPEH